MRRRRLLCWLLAVSLSAALCGCGGGGQSSSVPPSASGSGSSSAPDTSDVSSEAEPEPASHSPIPVIPSFQRPPEYDASYTLPLEIPELVDGLELPVNGATGYCSVQLPVYAELPGKQTAAATAAVSEDWHPTAVLLSASAAEGQGDAPVAPESGAPEAGQTPEAPPETGQPPETQENPPEQNPGTSTPQTPETGSSSSTQPASQPGTEQPPAPSEPPAPSGGGEGASSTQPPASSEGQAPAQDPNPPETQDPASSSEQPPEPEELPEAKPATVAVWEPGTAFRILQESGNWWYVVRGEVKGWIEHRYCMINLPDVIPSILYRDTNSYSSIFVSCGKEIPGVTGEAFYESMGDNPRLGRRQYKMPMLYASARDVCAAQHKALAQGNCLQVYQTFRPYDTQRAVVEGLSALAQADPEVKAGISTPPWSITWFISTGTSNHQKGYALDVSMVKVTQAEVKQCGGYSYLSMTRFAPYEMPTDMHELSMAAASTLGPNSSELSPTMAANAPAMALREYFTSSGFSPLASEWWHFNNVTARNATAGNPSKGRYFITECLSAVPG